LGLSSSSENQRPIAGCTPKTSTSDAVACIPATWTESPRPERTKDAGVDPPIAENTWFLVHGEQPSGEREKRDLTSQ
jgi:hypothetical protein